MITERLHIFKEPEPLIKDQFEINDDGEESTDEESVEESDEEYEEESNEEYEDIPPLLEEDVNNAELDPSSSTNDWLPPIDKESVKFIAYTTYLDDNGVIYMVDDINSESSINIKASLAAYYSNYDVNRIINNWRVGESCVAYDSLKNEYVRTRILEVDEEHKMCSVRYVDYGTRLRFPFESLRKGTPTHDIPSLAYPCLLYNTMPIGGVWTKEALDCIHEDIMNSQCEVTVIEFQNDTLLVDLLVNNLWMPINLPYKLFRRIYCPCPLHAWRPDHRETCPCDEMVNSESYFMEYLMCECDVCSNKRKVNA
ncbi:RING finger protein 17-like [Spodoptera litura]|uniref:RING finger protein 17-like n=1 Tax=Spodoptera litura TaxID=69820 RepID=A0A9J7ER73_SPOLT|nr:RING finger protein 17-like [Spodoptera litura]